MEKNLDSSDSETSKDDDFIALATLSNKKNGIEICLEDTIPKYTDKELTNPIHIRHHKPMREQRELEKVVSGIHFVVTPQHFIGGMLKQITHKSFKSQLPWMSVPNCEQRR
ncbi:unnamed protein product [Ceratitis capitata]|uniref:(Mediterranean fruit fly) hypothetical protein n=1 Tax=Ceratitis capitata TaxID=7213 RepID=A0A811UEI4_CERCA|nr:unnamed protein product [Ceratitis capitata]